VTFSYQGLKMIGEDLGAVSDAIAESSLVDAAILDDALRPSFKQGQDMHHVPFARLPSRGRDYFNYVRNQLLNGLRSREFRIVLLLNFGVQLPEDFPPLYVGQAHVIKSCFPITAVISFGRLRLTTRKIKLR
jgi:hypothetical protein